MQAKFALSLIAVAALSACGGGGGDDPAPATPQFASCSVTIPQNVFGATPGTTTVGVPTSANLTCAQVQAKVDEMLAAATNLAIERDRAVQAADTASREAAALRGEVTRLNTRVGELTTQVTTANNTISARNAEIIAKNVEIAQLRANQGNPALIASLTTERDAALAEVTRLNGEVTRLMGLIAASGDATAQLAAAQALRAEAAADKAAADAALAAAQAAGTASAADRAAAEAALANVAATVTAAVNAAQAAAAIELQAANSARILVEGQLQTANLRITALEAQIATLTAQGATDTARIAELTTQLAAEREAATAAATAAATTIAALNAQIASLQSGATASQQELAFLAGEVARLTAVVTDLQAQLANGGGNPTGLPFCVANPTPIAANSVFTGAGTSCVISYADQKALADAIALAAGQVKFEGVYSNDEAVMIAEVGGKLWTLDQSAFNATTGAPDAVFGDITTSNGTQFQATSKSLGYTHRAVTQSGSYDKGVKSSTRLVYANFSGNPVGRTTNHVDLLAINGAFSFNAPAGGSVTMGGQEFFSNFDVTPPDSHDIRLTVNADNTFNGAVNECKYTGTMTPTPYAYHKVSITWGANCAVPAGTIGAGVITQYGTDTGGRPIYLLMSNQAGQYSDIAFVSFFNTSWSPGNAAPMSLTALKASAKAMSISKGLGSR